MYNVYIDGKLLYSTAQEATEQNIILNPSLSLEVNKSGSFSFVMPPGHVLYDNIEKLKSVVTVDQDGEEIFSGRVLNDKVDFFNQKSVHCEGELCYFLDSLQPPCEYDGTAMGLLQQILDNHNSAVEEEKRFYLGNVTAFQADRKAQVDMGYHTDTLNVLNTRMLGAYGGYFRIRRYGNRRYLDYLSETDTNAQPIEFGVNLLDLTRNISANEVFTVLLPLGANDKENNPLTVASVNNGLEYIEDTNAVAKYGRIWKTKTWGYIEDAAELLTVANEYLATGISEETTLTIKAVDMHFVDGTTQRIGIGDMVRIVSNPHGLDRTIICYQMQVDLLNPENTEYTFGKPAETLTDNAVLAKKKLGGGGGGSPKTIEDEIKEWNTWADIFEDDAKAQLQLTTGAINLMNGNSTGADIDLNGVVPLVKLSAHQQDIDTVNGNVDLVRSEMLINVEGIRGQIQQGDEVMSELALTIEGLDNWVTDADGNVSELTNEVRGLQSTVTTVDGKIVSLSNTADGFRSTIMEQGITLAELKTVNDQISATMKDVEGDIGSLVVTSDAVTAKVQTADNRVAALAITADGLTNTIAVQGVELAALKTRIDEISASVTDGNNAAASLVIQANRITQKVTDLQNETSASLTVMADSINAKVSKGKVISEINQTAETIKISASKINLEGYVTASQLSAVNASISNLTSGLTTATVLSSNLVRATNTDFTYLTASAFSFGGDTVSKRNISMGSITSAGKALSTGELDLSHSHEVIVNDDGTITLGGVSATGGNFRIADTKVYKDGVSAVDYDYFNSSTDVTQGQWALYGGPNTYRSRITLYSSLSNGKSKSFSFYVTHTV